MYRMVVRLSCLSYALPVAARQPAPIALVKSAHFKLAGASLLLLQLCFQGLFGNEVDTTVNAAGDGAPEASEHHDHHGSLPCNG